MAKRGTRGRSRRGTLDTANRRLPTSTVSYPVRSSQLDLEDLIRDRNLSAIEDRRVYHPDGPHRAARSISGRSDHRLIDPWKGISFDRPDEVVICVRRKTRKEVMHALKHAGKAGQRRPRRNRYSDVEC